MLYRLEITVYDVKGAPPSVLKASLNHNLHVLFTVILLNHLAVLYLVRGPEYPFGSFTPPSLDRILITLHV
jgi:hypothetical protein